MEKNIRTKVQHVQQYIQQRDTQHMDWIITLYHHEFRVWLLFCLHPFHLESSEQSPAICYRSCRAKSQLKSTRQVPNKNLEKQTFLTVDMISSSTVVIKSWLWWTCWAMLTSSISRKWTPLELSLSKYCRDCRTYRTSNPPDQRPHWWIRTLAANRRSILVIS